MLCTEYDICIIGAGAAGIIIALELTSLNHNKKILIIEFGKENSSKENSLDDSIKIDNPINHHAPYDCTNKGFGGTTATWGGRCVMYDEIDFINREIINNQCTWDLNLYEDLKKYLSRTVEYFQCGEAVFNLNDASFPFKKSIAENFKSDYVTDSTIERWSLPSRFKKEYYNKIKGLKNITILEGQEAVNFSEPDNIGNVKFLTIINTESNKEIKIKSSFFVISAGAQETTRLLLRNKSLFKNLTEVPKALGKYYQSHISGKIASVKFYGDPKKTDYGFMRDMDGVYVRRRFQFTKDFLLKNNLLNTCIWLDNPLYEDANHKNGAMSFMYICMLIPFLRKRLAPPAIAYSITKGKRTQVWKHLKNILFDFPSSLLKPAEIFLKRYFPLRKLPGIFLFNSQNTYALHFHAEQIPMESNKMELGIDGKTLNIKYSLCEKEIQSIIELHEILDAKLRYDKCGELIYWYPKPILSDEIKKMSKDGIHQSGTTRIASTVEDGVVDENLKLFGTSNLYICSSSVFPTSSQANPTFYLGAFAVRLAKLLASEKS